MSQIDPAYFEKLKDQLNNLNNNNESFTERNIMEIRERLGRISEEVQQMIIYFNDFYCYSVSLLFNYYILLYKEYFIYYTSRKKQRHQPCIQDIQIFIQQVLQNNQKSFVENCLNFIVYVLQHVEPQTTRNTKFLIRAAILELLQKKILLQHMTFQVVEQMTVVLEKDNENNAAVAIRIINDLLKSNQQQSHQYQRSNTLFSDQLLLRLYSFFEQRIEFLVKFNNELKKSQYKKLLGDNQSNPFQDQNYVLQSEIEDKKEKDIRLNVYSLSFVTTLKDDVRADFLPVYPENSWTGHFAGLFHTFYEALDDLCEFRAPNVSSCHVGSRIKDMLRGMKRYLTKMSLITWSPDEFKSWFESRDKKMELEQSRRKNTQGKKKKDGKQKPPKTRSTSKKKRQTGPISQSKEVNTYTKVRQQLQEPRRQKPDPLGNKNQKDFGKAQPSHRRAQQAGPPLLGTTMVPFRCGQCQKEYKNLKSYMTHMYQTHKKYIPPGSSHDIHGRILLTPLTKPSRFPTKPDQTQYPGLTPVALPPLPSCHLDPSRDQVLAFKADLDKQCGQEVMSKFTEEQIDALILEQWRRTLKQQGKIQEEKSEQPQKKQKKPRPCQN